MTYKLPVGSYTFLNTYLTCPYQAFRRYIVKDIVFVSTEKSEWGNTVHTAFELRLRGKKPLPDNMRQWEHFCVPMDKQDPLVEQWFGLTRNMRPTESQAKDVWFRGKVDCVLFNTQTYRQAIIWDWKTGRVWEDPFELQTSALFVKMTYPQIDTLYGYYVWLQEDRVGKPYDLINVGPVMEKVVSLMTEIEQRLLRGIEFEKKPNKLCAWCSVKDCEHNTNEDAGK